MILKIIIIKDWKKYTDSTVAQLIVWAIRIKQCDVASV